MSTQSPEARPEQVDQPSTESLQQHSEIDSGFAQAKEIPSEVTEPSASTEQAANEPEPTTEQAKEEVEEENNKPKETPAEEGNKKAKNPVVIETTPSEYLSGGYLYCRSNGLIPHVIKRYFFIKDSPMPLEYLNYYYKKHFQGSLNKQPEDDPSLSSEQANESSSLNSQSLYVDRIAKAVEGCKGLLFYSKSQCTSVPSGIISLLDVEKVEAGNGNKFLLFFENGKTETLEALNTQSRDAWIKDLNVILSQRQEIKEELENSSTYGETLTKLNKIANNSGASPLETLRSLFPSFKGKSTKEEQTPSEAAEKPEPTSPKDNVFDFFHYLLKGKDHEKSQEEKPEETVNNDAADGVTQEEATEAPSDVLTQQPETTEQAVPESNEAVQESPNKKRGYGLLAYSKSWKTPKAPKSAKSEKSVQTEKGSKATQPFENTKAKLEHLPTSLSRKLTEFVHKKKHDKPADAEVVSLGTDSAAVKPEEPPTPTSTPAVKTVNEANSTTENHNGSVPAEESTQSIIAPEPSREPVVPEIAA
ncbi:meiotic chromosome segregation protein Meu6 [Schizosaccharomyces cryophilus OY26]|uniref:Meiotic chromosome segregation protein Meu6 n=1 Tax=Schizosaccharomyces cryophilus (strain OY26 / ATCC MYA-4695 / CBS 11777 / NBRC 106824 / NRRL Y48691) TaxID=653667 RepID=S9XBE7_SCHCR|nr:meiotic chromosome segregation protein Meu6 [Schizosaccharomyces cryophilus OY26]EPY51101.1 meiotic chromosome segregation protein Meu6 [Schizosaccharomyces cryophilus OY26]